jgi:CRISPR/Cas system-associated protein endoribonuclease Cas2
MKLVSVMLAAFDVPLSATNTNKVCELPQVLHLILLKWPFFLGQFSLVRKVLRVL